MGSVVITGASSGFGRAAAKCFSEVGFDLVLVARRADRLAEVKAALSKEVDVLTIALDVRHKDDVLSSLAALPGSLGEVSVLINSAGLALGLGGADEADLDDWDAMVDTNIKGLMYCTRAILPSMVARGVGQIINIGSVAASWPYPGGNVYGGTKAFVQQFSRNLRADLLGKGIRVANIEPGMCDTEFSKVRFGGDEAQAAAVYQGMQPLSAEDVAKVILWVAMCPPHVNVNQLELMPVSQAWSGFSVHRSDGASG